jgi:GNAT superfamily N-acetyltransferase
MESVRVASEHDRGRLVELAGELTATLSAQRGGLHLVEPALDDPDGSGLGARLELALRRPDTQVLVGMLDDVVVAFAACTVEEDRRGVRRGRLDACFVEEDARGVGVGRLLMDRSLAWLGEQGCAGVDGVAHPGDRTAKTFYEGAGFKARLLTMHRELGGPPSE